MKSILFSISLLLSSTLCLAQQIETQLSDFPVVGQINTRTTLEITASDLWIGGEVLDRDYADYDAYKEYLDSLGAKKIRLQSGWAKTEKVKGVYDFTWLDRVVNDALSRSVQPWIQISYGNELYPQAGGISLGEGLPRSEEALNAFTKYAEALVHHFKDRVHEWEIWNEADHRYNEAGPEPYAELYYRTAQKVREAQPDAILIGLSIAYVGNTEYADFFFNYLKERNALDLVDVVTFHGYSPNPDDGFDAVEKLQKTVHSYRPGLPFWQGETGCPSSYGSSGALSGHPWTELTQAKWDARRALAHIGRGYPFSLFTISEYTYDRQKFKGLNTKGILKVNDDLSIAYAKPAYRAYQHLTTIFTHDLALVNNLNVEVPDRNDLEVFAWKNQDEQSVIALWEKDSIPVDNNTTEKVDFTVQAKFTHPVYVDVRTGKVRDVPPEAWTHNEEGCRFTSIPVYDSPVLIAEKTAIPITETSQKK